MNPEKNIPHTYKICRTNLNYRTQKKTSKITRGSDKTTAGGDARPVSRSEYSVDGAQNLSLQVPDHQVIDLTASDDKPAVAGDVQVDGIFMVLLGEIENLSGGGWGTVGFLGKLVHLDYVRQGLVDDEGLAIRRPAHQTCMIVLDIDAK